eukprot:1477151-Rhodomonas_salina.1
MNTRASSSCEGDTDANASRAMHATAAAARPAVTSLLLCEFTRGERNQQESAKGVCPGAHIQQDAKKPADEREKN